MKHYIGRVEFEYNEGLFIGQIFIHDFYFDVYRKNIEIDTEDNFKRLCEEAYEKIPVRWKEYKID